MFQPRCDCRSAVSPSGAPIVHCVTCNKCATHSLFALPCRNSRVCLSVCLSLSQNFNSGNEWSRVLLEELIVPQLVNKFLPFYRTRRSITVFTKARQLSLSWPTFLTLQDGTDRLSRNVGKELPEERSSEHQSSSRLPIVLFMFHSNTDLPPAPGLAFGFPQQNFLCIYFLSPTTPLTPTLHSPWSCHPNNICWAVQRMQLVVPRTVLLALLPIRANEEHRTFIDVV
jgi:hypothetical protein